MVIEEVVKVDLNITTGIATIVFKNDGVTYKKELALYNEDGTVNEKNFELYNKICEKDREDYDEGKSITAKEENATYNKIIGGLKLVCGSLFLLISLKDSMKLYDIGKTPDYEVLKSYDADSSIANLEELEYKTAEAVSALTLTSALAGTLVARSGVSSIVEGIKESKELKKKRK